jgi:drug/metabolite transporter (DMT)-like permease
MSDIFGAASSFAQLGEFLSFASAFLWAVAVVLFRVVGEKAHPVAMNLFKNALAVLLLVPTLAVFGEPLVPSLDAGRLLWLFASGVIGIAVADTLFFEALNRLGAELTAIVDCAYAPFVIGLSFLFLGERMGASQTAGVGLIILAVVLIALKKGDGRLPRRTLLAGIGIGIVALFFQAVGIVMFKPILKEVPLLQVCLVRMLGGTLGAAASPAFLRRPGRLLRPLFAGKTPFLLLPASLLASYVSNVIWLGGMKYTLASIASALNQLNTIFIFILAALFLKEKITPLKLAAIGLAFAGAVLVSVPL